MYVKAKELGPVGRGMRRKILYVEPPMLTFTGHIPEAVRRGSDTLFHPVQLLVQKHTSYRSSLSTVTLRIHKLKIVEECIYIRAAVLAADRCEIYKWRMKAQLSEHKTEDKRRTC